jgi:hypothetical protein
MSDRAALTAHPLDEQPPAMRRQPRVSVNHEDLRMVKTRHLHYAGGPPSDQGPVTNVLAEYI